MKLKERYIYQGDHSRELFPSQDAPSLFLHAPFVFLQNFSLELFSSPVFVISGIYAVQVRDYCGSTGGFSFYIILYPIDDLALGFHQTFQWRPRDSLTLTRVYRQFSRYFLS